MPAPATPAPATAMVPAATATATSVAYVFFEGIVSPLLSDLPARKVARVDERQPAPR
ncbi:hypothetical protein Pma05_49920 [Plantactinospora mayteni]|uniref:Uncharacterized protein n=1 Tax=Plantactinospora mayteni TaxID=566021 RepID=A0ABQ4EUZ0_9ACTN|nr:hypothetical protein Pma05_49920 [Plantactinospora mayteni]